MPTPHPAAGSDWRVDYRRFRRVAGLSGALNPKGETWAELAVVGETSLTRMPDPLDFLTAAGIPIAGKTAVESLHTSTSEAATPCSWRAPLERSAPWSSRWPLARGIRVGGSSSARHDYLLSLGAEKTVDYTAPLWQEQVRPCVPGGVDAALAIQPGTRVPSQFVVRQGGVS